MWNSRSRPFIQSSAFPPFLFAIKSKNLKGETEKNKTRKSKTEYVEKYSLVPFEREKNML